MKAILYILNILADLLFSGRYWQTSLTQTPEEHSQPSRQR